MHVAETPERLALSVHSGGLSSKQDAALTAFAQAWHESGADAIVIETPANSVEEGDARAAAANVAAALQRMGVPYERVRRADYDAGGEPRAPVVARYTRLQAVGPDCAGHWSNLSSTYANGVTSHFGCATTANFAAMIADPRDLARVAPNEPADGVRRGVVLDKYRQGQITSSPKDDQARVRPPSTTIPSARPASRPTTTSASAPSRLGRLPSGETPAKTPSGSMIPCRFRRRRNPWFRR